MSELFVFEPFESVDEQAKRISSGGTDVSFIIYESGEGHCYRELPGYKVMEVIYEIKLTLPQRTKERVGVFEWDENEKKYVRKERGNGRVD